jgi:hypothetical protein
MRKGSFRFAVVTIALSAMIAGPLAEYASAQTQPVQTQSSQPVGAAGQTQIPQPADNSVNWPGAGYGAGALLCNVLYIPAKLTYAILGGVVGGGTYLVTAGNTQAANTVWRSSFGGDYVVTPQMLAGQQPINFSGPTETPPTVPAPSSSSGMATTTTASSGGIAPITPIPSSGTSASASSTNAGGQPLDHGSGPASGGSASNANIE